MLNCVGHGFACRGGIELVDFFYASCNDKLASHMRDECARVERGAQEYVIAVVIVVISRPIVCALLYYSYCCMCMRGRKWSLTVW